MDIAETCTDHSAVFPVSSPSQSYVTLEAAGCHKVIIPARAAQRSRVLAYLYKGLLVMGCHRCQGLQSSTSIASTSTHEEGEVAAVVTSKRGREGDHHNEEDEREGEEKQYISFAVRDGPVHATALQDVVVPLHTLTPDALCRVSEYLMMDSPDGMRALHGMRPDSQEDIQRVTEIVRAADFLQC